MCISKEAHCLVEVTKSSFSRLACIIILWTTFKLNELRANTVARTGPGGGGSPFKHNGFHWSFRIYRFRNAEIAFHAKTCHHILVVTSIFALISEGAFKLYWKAFRKLDKGNLIVLTGENDGRKTLFFNVAKLDLCGWSLAPLCLEKLEHFGYTTIIYILTISFATYSIKFL